MREARRGCGAHTKCQYPPMSASHEMYSRPMCMNRMYVISKTTRDDISCENREARQKRTGVLKERRQPPAGGTMS